MQTLSLVSSPWFLLLGLAGMVIVGLAYFYSPQGIKRRWRWILFSLASLAWLGLTGLLLQPLWVQTDSEFTPPSVVLAVDRSLSYAAGQTLHFEPEVREGLEAVRHHYASLGFGVLTVGFAAMASTNLTAALPGELTRLSALRNILDSLGEKNVQGVFLWTDGRFNGDTETVSSAGLAPIFPVIPRGKGLSEVQGEKLEIDFASQDSGCEATVEWRSLIPRPDSAWLELQSGTETLWREHLTGADSSGLRRRHTFSLPNHLARELTSDANVIALVRPDPESSNLFAANDTVEIRRTGLPVERHFFLRPLNSMEERGLLDGLAAAESLEVRAISAESLAALETRPGDVIWSQAKGSAAQTTRARLRSRATPWIHYSLEGSAHSEVKSGGIFSGDARVMVAPEAAPFFPAGVLRLADLGVGKLPLPKWDGDQQPLAWVEEGNRKAMLFWQARKESPDFFLEALPLWPVGFKPDADERVASLTRQWTQGIGEFARHAEQALNPKGKTIALSKPWPSEQARLGVDREALLALASATRGKVLEEHILKSVTFNPELPDLPRAQTHAETQRSRPALPFAVTAFLVVVLFVSGWTFRKIFHLD